MNLARAREELRPGWTLIAFDHECIVGEWLPDLIPPFIEAHQEEFEWDVNSCYFPLFHQTLREQVAEFHSAFCPDQRLGEGPPSVPDAKTVKLRLRLITEEFFETLDSAIPFDLETFPHRLPVLQERVWNDLTLAKEKILSAIDQYADHDSVDIVKLADALADLDYVVEGTRIAFGIDSKPIADEVHRSNLTKIGGHRREDGKWVKPDTYSPADVKGELMKQGWKP